ncbi:hypothetical protein CTAYLR_008820 [Chrysophaeum taylorii]|uniref:Succinate dehydrogenase subunit C n=1 Tax=Chrysophaeum taylorii TaxID=2483200 RepID=A0AAD7XM66_9STRA|nr:hypothetical protein CTAYLR_008820 [Chrysophaeum taylorii]
MNRLARGLATYTDRMKAMGRPVSPHVTQYAFPIAAVSSITQRVTGVLLSVGLGGVAAISLAGGDVGALAASLGSSPAAPAAKFAVAFPLVYHFLGAMRHTIWDKIPETLENDKVERSSWALIGVATVASVGLAAATLPKKKD